MIWKLTDSLGESHRGLCCHMVELRADRAATWVAGTPLVAYADLTPPTRLGSEV